MADTIRDLIWKAQNRRTNRTPRVNPTNPNPIAPMRTPRRDFLTDSPEAVRNASDLSPAANNLRERYAGNLQPDNLQDAPRPTDWRTTTDGTDEGVTAPESPNVRTFSPSEQKLKERFSGDLGNGMSSDVLNESLAPTQTPQAGKLRDYYSQKYDSLAAREEAVNARREALKDKNFEDDDSKLHNFGAGASYAMRDLQRTGNSQADLGATIGAALGGGLRGLFNKKEDDIRENETESQQVQKDREKLDKEVDTETDQAYRRAQTAAVVEKPIIEREKLAAKIQSDISRAQARTDAINQQADIRSGEAKIFVDENGKQWKQFLKADSTGKTREMEPIINPTTGEQAFAPGEEMVDWQSPTTGAWSKIKAKQAVMPDATIGAGNANRQQQTNENNASREMEAQRQNVTGAITYNKAVLNKVGELAKLAGSDLTNVGELQGIAAESVSLAEQLQEIDTSDDTDGKKTAAANKIIERLATLQNDYQQALGKTNAGRTVAEELRKQGIMKPPTVKAVKTEAVKVSGGISNSVSKAVFQQRLKANNIPESEWESRTQKAMTDGVVK